MNYPELRAFFCDIGRRIWTQGWIAANDGNFSAKLAENLFLTTPTGVSKGYLSPEMLILVDKCGKKLEESKWNPSSELPLHLRCYEERPDVAAVVHAHPPAATAFAVAHIPLDKPILSEAVMSLGAVPVAPYGCPGTSELPDSAAPFLKEHDAILLANHGALTVGADLQTAYFRMETLEHFAKLCLNLRILGEEQDLPPERVEELMRVRRRMGLTGRHPGAK
jgi:L-fuculose-phosphate aldolase